MPATITNPLQVVQTTGVNAEVDIQSVAGTDKHWGIYNNRADNGLRFWNNDIAGEKNALTILNNGNVGIGTTGPGAKLEIAGQIKITGGTPGGGKVLVSDASGLASWSASAPLYSFSETDPKVGTLTTGKWCTNDGAKINCTATVPTGNTGATGHQGSAGPTGATGPQGLQGLQGLQ